MADDRTKSTLVEKVGHTTIRLHVWLEPRDPKWNGYAMSIRTDEGFAISIKGVSIWGLTSWIRSLETFLDDDVRVKVREMTDCYPR